MSYSGAYNSQYILNMIYISKKYTSN